jgi:hypothetical protein
MDSVKNLFFPYAISPNGGILTLYYLSATDKWPKDNQDKPPDSLKDRLVTARW